MGRCGSLRDGRGRRRGRDHRLRTVRRRSSLLRSLRGSGFLLTGTSYQFVFDVTGELPPVDPAITVRAYVEGENDELFSDTLAGGFGTGWDEPRRKAFIEAGRKLFGYTPDLWLLATHEGCTVGALQGFEQWVASADMGWVKKLAVLPEGRNHGVGRALLHASFHIFKERGRRLVFLGVEEATPTGARTFYERLDMTQSGTQTTQQRAFER